MGINSGFVLYIVLTGGIGLSGIGSFFALVLILEEHATDNIKMICITNDFVKNLNINPP
jgi:hypothetical protein